MMAYVPRSINSDVARMRPVQDELDQVARRIEGRASALLSQHRDRGHARIVSSRGKVDRFVSLDDERGYPAAAAIEFGHLREDGTFVEGIHVLGRSI
jgi:hypothetical protein